MPTLLIIDDNESVRDTLGHVFTRHGYTVQVAENGLAGLAIFASKNIDAVIIDINMPGPNGVQVCRLLRAQARSVGRSVPMWLMTGAIGGYVEEMALEAGALAVLHKPFDTVAFARELAERLATANVSRSSVKGEGG